MSPPHAIETTSVRKEFGDVVAVSNLDLTVEFGEVFGFLGPNGAGKSTTIDMLVDFARPTAGTIRVVGYDPQRRPRAVRERVGILPQASGFYRRTTARDHVAFAVEMKRAADDPEVLLDRVDLADDADRPVDGFSKGMRQRLGLAVALVGRPDLLVLDEPLGGLDPRGARLFRDIVRTERDRGAAVFLSSHIMDQVETLCDRVGIMHDGELVSVDTVEGLRRRVDGPDRIDVVAAGVSKSCRFESVDGVVAVSERDGTVRITCAGATAVDSVLDSVRTAGGSVVRIESRTTPLEHVFLKLTDSTVTERAETGPEVDA